MKLRYRYFRAALALAATLLAAGAIASLVFIHRDGSAADRIAGTAAAVLLLLVALILYYDAFLKKHRNFFLYDPLTRATKEPQQLEFADVESRLKALYTQLMPSVRPGAEVILKKPYRYRLAPLFPPLLDLFTLHEMMVHSSDEVWNDFISLPQQDFDSLRKILAADGVPSLAERMPQLREELQAGDLHAAQQFFISKKKGLEATLLRKVLQDIERF
ncbi:MAG: hypothetical protein PUC59_06865 [Firmicutes bacterium]|nr:hypothetical protein [Bacillota bacterium]